MKKTWDEPRIEVQRFVANDHVAVCYDLGHAVVSILPTDGKISVDEDDEYILGDDGRPVWNYMGFDDEDGMDFLTGSHDTKANGVSGWYITAEKYSTYVKATDDYQYMGPHDSAGGDYNMYGNHVAYSNEYKNTMASTVYFLGTNATPILITANNSYGVGPNAS